MSNSSGIVHIIGTSVRICLQAAFTGQFLLQKHSFDDCRLLQFRNFLCNTVSRTTALLCSVVSLVYFVQHCHSNDFVHTRPFRSTECGDLAIT